MKKTQKKHFRTSKLGKRFEAGTGPEYGGLMPKKPEGVWSKLGGFGTRKKKTPQISLTQFQKKEAGLRRAGTRIAEGKARPNDFKRFKDNLLRIRRLQGPGIW